MNGLQRAMAAGLWVCAVLAAQAQLQAQHPLAGAWKTIDDKTGQARSIVTISERDGIYVGRITQRLGEQTANLENCDKCSDDRRGMPIIGLEIIRGMKKADGAEYYEGGQILDPEEGKLYRLRLTPIEGGKKLQVRGYLGPFWRTQVWERP